MKPLVIVGSGLAAYMLAREWRKYDKETPLTMVTKSAGHYYSKPQLSTALAKKQSVRDLVLQDAAAMEQQLNADILTETTVTDIDSQNKIVSIEGKAISYSQLVLALGADPITLSLQGDAADDCLSINQLEDYGTYQKWLEGKKHLVILGTGLVGCEMMNDLLCAGYEVTMITLDDTPLARFVPAVMGEAFQSVLAEHRVSWHLNVSALSIDSCAAGYRVTLSNGQQVEADGVVSAVGLRANTQLADQAGLLVERGIVVDRFLKSSQSDIYALGDCAQVEGAVLQYVAPLLASARALAKTLSGEPTQVQYPPMPVVIKTTLCPVVTLLSDDCSQGHWHIEGANADWEAKCINNEGDLLGFSLMGACIKKRGVIVKDMKSMWE